MSAQGSLFTDVKAKRKVQRGDVIFSLSFDERKIIQAIIELYNNGEPFDVDPTYSQGRFWQGLPQPLQKFDLYPQTADTRQANSHCLPLEDESVGSVMFDPPFVIKNVKRDNAKLGKIEKRFFGYPTMLDLHMHYTESLQEFFRILRPGGIVAFKCQDTTTGGINYPIHGDVLYYARSCGFAFEDIFILGNKQIMLAPNLANQKHARKSHCYFLVFRKPIDPIAARLQAVRERAAGWKPGQPTPF